MKDGAPYHAGRVAVVGRPNVGKSTLLNRLVGEAISVTSRKAQTTRYCITGIVTTAEAQIAFIDTPGYQLEHVSVLNRAMNRAVARSLPDADVTLWVIEALKFDSRDRCLQPLARPGKPLVLAVNKIDRLRDRAALLPFLQELDQKMKPSAIVPVSARRGTGIAALVSVLAPLLPQGSPLFGDDDLTTMSERGLAAELIREQLFRRYGEELPYACAVEIESFQVKRTLRVIQAVILVEKDSQKAIVIGRRGDKLKEVASHARLRMERLFGSRVHLSVWVKCKPGWMDDERTLRQLGFDLGS